MKEQNPDNQEQDPQMPVVLGGGEIMFMVIAGLMGIIIPVVIVIWIITAIFS